MPEYAIINMDLFRVLPTAASFTWWDGVIVNRYILEKTIALFGDEYDENNFWKPGMGMNFFSKDIYEFPDDKTAKLWFKLNH